MRTGVRLAFCWSSMCLATDVHNALTHFVLLRANVTDNDAFDQALLKRFNVVAPPTMVFFGEGNAIQSLVAR